MTVQVLDLDGDISDADFEAALKGLKNALTDYQEDNTHRFCAEGFWEYVRDRVSPVFQFDYDDDQVVVDVTHSAGSGSRQQMLSDIRGRILFEVGQHITLNDANTILAGAGLPRYEKDPEKTWTVWLTSRDLYVNVAAKEDPIVWMREKFAAFLAEIGDPAAVRTAGQMYSTAAGDGPLPSADTVPLLEL